MRVELLRTQQATHVLDGQSYILIAGTKGDVESTLDGMTLKVTMDSAIKPLAGAVEMANQPFGISANDLKNIE